MRPYWLPSLLLVTNVAMAAEDFRVMKLEQDMRNLERQVQALTREVSSLRTQGARTSFEVRTPDASAEAASGSQAWLAAAKWDRLRVGMDELEVIELLGPPTTMRQEDDRRVLLYALEIGASGFLGGSVQLRERQVVAIERPTLR